MSYKSKKIISFICCIIVLISITLVGCTNNASKTIVIWAWDSMAESATKAVAIYKENHPEIEYDFEVVTLGQDDMVEKVKIALSTNSKSTLPDIFYDEDYNFAEYLTYYGDYFYDITSLLDLSDYYSYKTANVVYDNKTYAIPYDSGTGVMFYRTDLIHDAGYKDSDNVICEKLFITPYITPTYKERNEFMRQKFDNIVYPPLETVPYDMLLYVVTNG